MWHRHVIILANIWSNDRNACQSCLKYKYVWIQEHFTFSWENALSFELGSSPNLNFKLPPFRVLSRPRKCCEYQDFLILDSTILDFVLRGPQVSCNSPWRRILWIKFDWETLLKIFCPALSVVRPRHTELRADSVLFQPFHIGGCRRLYSSLLGIESTRCKTPHFQCIYGKLKSD